MKEGFSWLLQSLGIGPGLGLVKDVGGGEGSATVDAVGPRGVCGSRAARAGDRFRGNFAVDLSVSKIDLLHFPEDGVIRKPGVSSEHLPERLAGQGESVHTLTQISDLFLGSLGCVFSAARLGFCGVYLAALVEVVEQ